ncbi:hypothetical protein, conserved, partial [Plasmodium malariae]
NNNYNYKYNYNYNVASNRNSSISAAASVVRSNSFNMDNNFKRNYNINYVSNNYKTIVHGNNHNYTNINSNMRSNIIDNIHNNMKRNNNINTIRNIFSNSSAINSNLINKSNSHYDSQKNKCPEENLLIIADDKKSFNSNHMLNEKMKLFKKRKLKNDYQCSKKNQHTNILKISKINDKMKGKITHLNEKCAVYKCINVDSSDENKS